MYKASLHLRDQEIQLLRQFDDTDDKFSATIKFNNNFDNSVKKESFK